MVEIFVFFQSSILIFLLFCASRLKWQQQQQQQQQQRYHDDSAAPAAARTRTRPTSIYDNVESNGDDYPSGGLRGAYLQLQTNPNEVSLNVEKK